MNSCSNLYYLHDRTKALHLLLLVGLIYLPFLNNPLVFDDMPLFARTIASFADAPFNLTLRWFPYSSLGFTWVFFSDNPIIFRVQNLLLHGLNVLMLWLLLRLWIKIFIADTGKTAEWGAWLGALVFACHPLAVYGVGYLTQRSILMATLFTLVMQLAYLRGILENKKSYLALAMAAYFLAVFSKEHSVMAPAILLPLTWLLRERIKFTPLMLGATWSGFALVALLMLLSAKGVIGVAYEPDAASLFAQQEMPRNAYLLSVLTQAGLFFKYCVLMLLPNPAWMSIDMRETFLFSYRSWTSWIGLLAFISYGLFALRCLLRSGRSALLGLALLYPWLLYMTEFSSIRIQENFVLYRSYLWLPGFMLIVPWLVSVLDRSLPLAVGVDEVQQRYSGGLSRFMLAGGLIALLLVPLSWNRLWVFADDYRLWDDAVQLLRGENRLGAQRTYYNRAQASVALKNWNAAIADYQKSLSIDTSHPQVFMALASAYYGAKRYTEALAILDKVIVLDEKNARAYYSKGIVMNALKDKAGALSNMQRSCALGEMTACAIVSMSHTD